MEIENRRVLVSGAGRGLGRALVTVLAETNVGEKRHTKYQGYRWRAD